MATYNSSRTLELALRTVLHQDFRDFEVWVIGDCCTDDTEAVVRSFEDPRIYWVNLESNSGSQGIPNNEGIRRARGEYIAYLGHDDLWFPWHISTLVDFIKRSGSDLVHPLSAEFSPCGLERTVGPPSIGRTYLDHFIFPSCWLHKKDIVCESGYWGEHTELSRGVDFEYLRRIYLSGKKISFIPRLTLLKFPSWMWGTYGKDYNPGQWEYFGKLEADPAGFEHEVLADAAVRLAIESKKKISPRIHFRELIKMGFHGICDLYGRERWPVKQILVWRFQRFRKRLKKKRGLS